MRKLSELIVVIRGGGEVGSAIAHILTRSHFRVCITEIANPLSLRRGVCYSEAVYETAQTIDSIGAERTLLSLESIYKVWRSEKIPVVVDPEMTVKPLIKPDVLINAMMLGRQTSTKIKDASLVIGIGPGLTVGTDAHLVIDSNSGENVGKVLIEGEVEAKAAADEPDQAISHILKSEDAGVFTTDRNIGEVVLAGDIIGKLNDVQLLASYGGVIRGLLRNEVKVLNNTGLVEIDPVNNKSVCFNISKDMRTLGGGVLEAILMSLNIEDTVQPL
jgi:xanthine dehydrogenase accessory factor